MKGTKLLSAVNDLASSLGKIAKELPKELEKLEGTISPEEMQKVSDLMNKSGFEDKAKELEKAKKELDEILKDVS